jgi:hypothetical protein
MSFSGFDRREKLMGETLPFPFAEDAESLMRHCKLPLHTGVGNGITPLSCNVLKHR